MSIHLCASDTRRLAPDPSREVVVWLTIVDLNAYNPVHASGAGAVPGQVHLTPSIEPIDMRHSFAVPGELACPLSEDEIERRLLEDEERRKEEEELEIKRLQTDRLARARSAGRCSLTPGAAPCASAPAMAYMQSPRETFKSEASLAAMAGMLAEADLEATPGMQVTERVARARSSNQMRSRPSWIDSALVDQRASSRRIPTSFQGESSSDVGGGLGV